MKRIIIIVSILVQALAAMAQEYVGKASFYGPGFHGRRAANGSIYDMNEMTCAHKSLPFGSILKVTNQNNGKSITVKVTDRGPYVKGRIIDLSVAAAKEIDMVDKGVVPVKVEVIERGDGKRYSAKANHKTSQEHAHRDA